MDAGRSSAGRRAILERTKLVFRAGRKKALLDVAHLAADREIIRTRLLGLRDDHIARRASRSPA
jgi:hypothetical protein